jgi:hypothetical protein
VIIFEYNQVNFSGSLDFWYTLLRKNEKKICLICCNVVALVIYIYVWILTTDYNKIRSETNEDRKYAFLKSVRRIEINMS